jgi:hypothetical protein
MSFFIKILYKTQKLSRYELTLNRLIIKNLTYTCILLVAVLITSHCSPSLKVTSDYDKAVNFQQYRTFVMDTVNSLRSINQLNQNRIFNAVKAEMIKKGFAESATPDLIIRPVVIIKDKQSITASTNYYGYGGYYRPYAWGGGMGTSGYTTYNVENYKEGSLIIDIAEAATKKLLWEGIGNKEIDKLSKDREKEINAGVSAIMGSFPPGTVKKKSM